jgi:hypothetical protein
MVALSKSTDLVLEIAASSKPNTEHTEEDKDSEKEGLGVVIESRMRGVVQASLLMRELREVCASVPFLGVFQVPSIEFRAYTAPFSCVTHHCMHTRL